jgi:hypothetical protein
LATDALRHADRADVPERRRRVPSRIDQVLAPGLGRQACARRDVDASDVRIFISGAAGELERSASPPYANGPGPAGWSRACSRAANQAV